MHRRVVNLFSIGKHSFLSFQALILSRLDLCVFDFMFLKYPQINQLQAILLPLFQIGNAVLDLLPLVERLAVFQNKPAGRAGNLIVEKFPE